MTSEAPSPTVGIAFDRFTHVFQKLGGSNFLNLGYWTRRTKRISTAQLRLVKEFGKFCRFLSGMRILDVGCGTGEQDMVWIKLFNPVSIHGMDLSSEHIKLAKKNAAHLAGRLTYEIADACNAPANLTGFHRIVALECVHLFPDIPSFFSGAHRALNENGILCIANLTYLSTNAFAPNLMDEIENELKWLNLAPHRGVLKNLLQSELEHGLTIEDMISEAKKAGFVKGNFKDATRQVIPFYPVFMKRVRNLISKTDNAGEINFLTLFAISFYMRKKQFENGSLGYYFIEFKKSSASVHG